MEKREFTFCRSSMASAQFEYALSLSLENTEVKGTDVDKLCETVSATLRKNGLKVEVNTAIVTLDFVPDNTSHTCRRCLSRKRDLPWK